MHKKSKIKFWCCAKGWKENRLLENVSLEFQQNGLLFPLVASQTRIHKKFAGRRFWFNFRVDMYFQNNLLLLFKVRIAFSWVLSQAASELTKKRRQFVRSVETKSQLLRLRSFQIAGRPVYYERMCTTFVVIRNIKWKQWTQQIEGRTTNFVQFYGFFRHFPRLIRHQIDFCCTLILSQILLLMGCEKSCHNFQKMTNLMKFDKNHLTFGGLWLSKNGIS